MPPPSSHAAALRPSPLLAVVCAAIVRAFDPSWISLPVAALSVEVDVRPERVSRLWRRLLGPMEKLLRRASTRGRKKKRRRPAKEERRRIRAEALLEVARAANRLGGSCKRRAQDFLVAARDRLKREKGISHRDFAADLGLSGRTIRSWAKRGVATPEEIEPDPIRKVRRPRGVGRFDLAVTLPDLQVVGDTTNLTVFGVPLKVVAFQDPGNRHLTPWKSFVVESEENQEVILSALKAAAGDRAGTQIIVDQGTPYLAEAVKRTCEELELLHEPQKEGTPTEKATKERQFGVVKHFLGPLLGLTQKLAEIVPSLRQAELAKAFARLILGTYLRVYVAAAAVRETNRPDDPTVLAEVAKIQRENAVAENRSKKLRLEAIFDRYGFEGSKRDFVRVHRRRCLEDIEEAEVRFVKAATERKIKKWVRYFGVILLNVEREQAETRRRATSRRRRETKERALRVADKRSAAAWTKALSEDPERRLAVGLGMIAGHYLPHLDVLWAGGVGPGTREAREALRMLFDQSATAAVDRAEVAWRIFEQSDRKPATTPHVRRVFEGLLASAKKENPSPADRTSATLPAGSHDQQNPRPPP